jgi:hypothetical protein
MGQKLSFFVFMSACDVERADINRQVAEHKKDKVCRITPIVLSILLIVLLSATFSVKTLATSTRAHEAAFTFTENCIYAGKELCSYVANLT